MRTKRGRNCPIPWEWVEVFVAIGIAVVVLTWIGNIVFVLLRGIISR